MKKDKIKGTRKWKDMENIEFSNACFEVLEILKYVKEEDRIKIPKTEIQILRDNANVEHKFVYDPHRSIKEQQVSKLAKGIIATLFKRYTASEQQKEKIRKKQKNDLMNGISQYS